VTERARPPLPRELEELLRQVLEASGLDLPARAEVEADLRAHFEDGLAGGRSAGDLAERFGDPALAGRAIAEARARRARSGSLRDGRWWMSAQDLWREVWRAARRLSRAPGFVTVVVLTLALGVGANTAIFTVLDRVLLEPLPYHEPGRLVRVYEATPDNAGDHGNLYVRAPTVAAYRAAAELFEAFGALYTYRELGADLTDGDRPERITVVPVTAGWFETLGVVPVLGRTFVEEETLGSGGPERPSIFRESSAPVVILGNRLWEELFDADPSALGRTVHLDDVPFEVVGIMPPDFRDPFGPEADAWVPLDLRPQMDNWGNFYLSAVARLPDGLTLEAAQERASALQARIVEANPQARDWGPLLVPLQADVVGARRSTLLWILAAAAALVLLTACLNVANLVLARGLERDRDVALRSALGAGRGRVLTGALAENLLLALAGGALGLGLGVACVRALVRVAPEIVPGALPPAAGASVFVFALGVTALALLGFGLAPAWRIAGIAPADALRAGDRGGTANRRTRRVRNGLVVVQVATATVLVAGAMLLARSFSAILSVPTAVDPQGVLTYEVNLPLARYRDGASRHAFHERLERRMESLPGVEAAGAVSWLPASGRYHIWSFYWDPADPSASGASDDRWYGTDVRVFEGNYLGAVGLSVLRGEAPADVDLDAERVAWISATTAEQVFGDADPIGQRIRLAGGPRRIVGIVEDVPVDARGRVTRHAYIPHAQYADDRNWALIQVVKARGDLGALREAIRSELRALDPDLVLHRPRLLTEVVHAARAQDRFATLLMGTLALLALALAVVGTYGVLAGSVASRRREIGVRLALGADPGGIRRMVFRYAAALTLPGILLGVVLALGGARFLEALLFGVDGRDPMAYAQAVLVFLGVGLLAGWAPAERATRVDPARTLQGE